MILAAAPAHVQAGVGKADHTLADATTASGWPAAPETDAEFVFAMELNSGTVLYDKGGEESCFPASTTKTMTALLTLENCDLDEEVTFSYNAVHDIENGGHHYEFQEGEVLTVDECLQFLLVESVNECAYALAEHVAGDVDTFVDMMNAKAQELGAYDTHFNNPHGLNDEDHYTTAHDMAMILWGCIQDPRFQQYADIQSISLKGHAIMTSGFQSYTNHHEMILYGNSNYDTDVVCGKTGFTSIAGSTLVTYGHRDDMDVIVVIMQGEDQKRFSDTKAVLDYAFDNFELVSAQEVSEELLREDISGLSLGTEIDEEQVLLLPVNGGRDALTSEFTPRSEEDTDLSVLGTRTWYYDGVEVGSSTVTLAQKSTSSYVSEEESAEGQTSTSRKTFAFGLTRGEFLVILVLSALLIVLLLIMLRILHVKRERRRIAKRRRERAAKLREAERRGRR